MWHHVVVVIKGATDITFYINGSDDGGTYSGNGGNLTYSENGSSCIGSNSGLGSFSDGIIDEVMIFDKALTAEEVELLYRIGID